MLKIKRAQTSKIKNFKKYFLWTVYNPVKKFVLLLNHSDKKYFILIQQNFRKTYLTTN